ncbi:elongation factor 1-beta [Nanoarchaeota archaeon]
MSMMYLTMRIMPDSPEASLADIEENVKREIAGYGGNVAKTEQIPIAFGLKAISITFTLDESKSTDELEEALSNVSNVQSVTVTDMRRAIG